MTDFKTKTITQIRLWSWAAAILPMAALAGIFFIWRFFDGSIFGYAMIAGETIMFTVAVVWWWWAMYVMRNLINHWDQTRKNVGEVLHDIKSMKSIVKELAKNDK